VNASDERRTVQTRTAMLAAALAVLLLAVAALASGCGSTSSSDDGVAALDDSSTTTSESETDESEDDAEQDPQEAALEWAKCMREHGVDVPDPEVDADGGRVTIRPGAGARRLDDIDSDAFRKAQEECGAPFGRSARGPQLTPEQREEMQEAMLEFARCMREHGVDMPDPEFSGEGGRMLFRQQLGQGGINPDSATFREAQEACQDILEDVMPARAGQGPSLSTGGDE
jgi:hypothetical protein